MSVCVNECKRASVVNTCILSATKYITESHTIALLH